jgi:hypothetical protein
VTASVGGASPPAQSGVPHREPRVGLDAVCDLADRGQYRSPRQRRVRCILGSHEARATDHRTTHERGFDTSGQGERRRQCLRHAQDVRRDRRCHGTA